MTRYWLLALLAGSCLAAAAQVPKEAPPALTEKVDRIFRKWDSTVSPGCALAVIKDAQIIYQRGYGMADLDHDVPIRPESVFHVASVSKQFTAAAIVLLAQDGKLSLDDEVRKYVPELPDFGARITIRHLIHHTSGLRDQWDLLGLAGWRYSLDLITDDDVLDLISRQRALNFQPGEKHVYCNTGYTLLAQIVKRVSGQSFREFTTERIFRPLGMSHTHFRDDHAEIVKHQAYGYDEAKGAFRLSVTNFDTVGATSLLTTVEDLAMWDGNFYEPRVGGGALVKQLLQPGVLNDGKKLDYAFGLALGKYRGLPTVDHGGADAGYRADLLRFPEQHFSVACLCNLAETNPGQLARRVADVYLANEFKELEAAAPGTPEKPFVQPGQQLSSYAGLYWNPEDEQAVKITLKEGKLFAMPSADENYEMTRIAQNRFRLVGPPVQMDFEQGKQDRPARISVTFGGAGKPSILEAVREFQPTPEQLAGYAGAYGSPEIDPVYRLSVENGVLLLKRFKHRPEKLEPTIPDIFRGSTGSFHFARDAEGTVSSFGLNTGRIRNFQFRKLADSEHAQ